MGREKEGRYDLGQWGAEVLSSGEVSRLKVGADIATRPFSPLGRREKEVAVTSAASTSHPRSDTPRRGR